MYVPTSLSSSWTLKHNLDRVVKSFIYSNSIEVVLQQYVCTKNNVIVCIPNKTYTIEHGGFLAIQTLQHIYTQEKRMILYII